MEKTTFPGFASFAIASVTSDHNHTARFLILDTPAKSDQGLEQLKGKIGFDF